MLTEFTAATYRRFAAGFGGDGSCNDAGARQSMLDAEPLKINDRDEYDQVIAARVNELKS